MRCSARRRTLASIFVLLFPVVVPTASAQAAVHSAQTLSPQRWARTICSAWITYTEAFDAALAEAFDPSRNLAEGTDVAATRERAITAQQTVISAATQVVDTVERTPRPRVRDGGQVRADYLATANDYLSVEEDFLEALRALPTATSAAAYSEAFAQAQGASSEAWDVIAYHPFEELLRVPQIGRAVRNESECQEVNRWFDLDHLSEVGIGDCWDEDQRTVDCAAAHAYEVFLQIEHPAARGRRYPGKALDAYAEKRCERAFEEYVSEDFQSSSLGLTYFVPDESDWDANDREILCTVSSIDGSPLTESARGSGR